MTATVVALFLCPVSRAPLTAVPRVQALADAGLEGDRHAKRGSHRQVLMMPAEILDQLGLDPGDVREQVTVRGLDLDALPAGTRLRVGNALLEVGNPCHPCERMNEIRAGLRETLVGRRGRFASVVEAGGFAVGDRFEVEPGTGA
jgi:MOSC domain-containing protein YiiM